MLKIVQGRVTSTLAWKIHGRRSLVGCSPWGLEESDSTDSCDPVDYSPSGASVHGIFQARILEWVAMLYSRGSSQPRDRARVSYISCIGRQVLYL